MRPVKCIVVGVILFFCSTSVKATDGCLINGGVELYINPSVNLLTGGHKLYSNTLSPLSDNYCSWVATSYTGNSCGVCSGLGLCVLGICPCLGIPKYGLEGSFTMVQCNLDDYTWTLGAAAGLFGVFVIRRRNKL
jgi:hypothetical protein